MKIDEMISADNLLLINNLIKDLSKNDKDKTELFDLINGGLPALQWIKHNSPVFPASSPNRRDETI